MKKGIVKALVFLLVIMMVFSTSACANSYEPKSLGDSLGMYLYQGATKMLLDGSESGQVVESVEYNGVTYNIEINDYRYVDDYFYFCAEFDENNFVGLFRYDFLTMKTDTLFVKNVSVNIGYTSLSIQHITFYFITLKQCVFEGEGFCGQYEFGTHEYFSVDYSGNVVNTGFDDSEKYSDTVAYTGSYRLIRQNSGAGNVYEIEHLLTREKVLLGTVTEYQMAYYLYFYETEDLFCFITQKSDPYEKYLVLYDKETQTLHKELWGVSDDACIIDMDLALFYANKSIYKYQKNEGLVAVHSSDYFLSNPQVLHNGLIVFSAYDATKSQHSTYIYDSTTNQKVVDASSVEYYGNGQYYFDDYIFYITKRNQMMWTTHYYLNRVTLATKKNEVVYYRKNAEIQFDRIGY